MIYSINIEYVYTIRHIRTPILLIPTHTLSFSQINRRQVVICDMRCRAPRFQYLSVTQLSISCSLSLTVSFHPTSRLTLFSLSFSLQISLSLRLSTHTSLDHFLAAYWLCFSSFSFTLTACTNDCSL